MAVENTQAYYGQQLRRWKVLSTGPWGLYYKHIAVVNEAKLRLKLRPRLGHIYSTGIIHDDRHMMIVIYHILLSIVCTFFIENDAEILHVHYTWKVAFTDLFHKQSIQVKL